MRPRLALLFAALSLSGCAGYHGPQMPELATSADMVDTFPAVTNDGFYDGGVFDEDLVDIAPLRPE